MPQIICEDLALGYEGKTVTKNISFKVNAGDYLCIVGENGSGKSTLVKALVGLVKPQTGIIRIEREISRGGMGYLPQQIHIQKDFPASVKEVVLSGCAAKHGFYGQSAKKRAHTAMHKLEIEGISKQSIKNLSGGQQQRVFLARALCSTGSMLVLDEPVTGLDPTVTEDLYSLLKKLNQKDGLSVIMVSHDINAAVKYATHILHIDSESNFFGPTSEYLKSELGKRFINCGGDDNE